ncbi:MAG: phosphohistidine phosphatase SixA [Thermodesulfobacteriota bacterium]
MKVYLVRHADAIPAAPVLPDASRHLSADGRASFRETARRLMDDGVRPSLILSSPLVRALQTADILAERLEYEGEVSSSLLLGPGFDLEKMNEILLSFPGETEIALVGHEPDIGRIVARLLGRPGGFAMPKGGVAAFSFPDSGKRDKGTFVWLRDGERRVDDLSDL